MSRQHHFYGANHLHYLTTIAGFEFLIRTRFRLNFTRNPDDLRAELGFKIIGYVLMPEHFHLLIWPSEFANPSQVLQRLGDRTALFILKNLRRNLGFAWCQRVPKGLKLPPTMAAKIANARAAGIRINPSPAREWRNLQDSTTER